MRLSRIDSAKNAISEYFDSLAQKVFLRKDLYQILATHHRTWKLKKSTSVDTFLDNLIKMGLREITLTSPNYDNTFTRFLWGKETPVHQLAISLRLHSYLSHHTAMYVHGLADRISNVTYVNSEQSAKPAREGELVQERIDAAFKRKPRTSKYIFICGNSEICCLNGTNTKNLGITNIDIPGEGSIPVTNLERTLIDAAVRPFYSGGCHQVLHAYEKARRRVSINRLISMLKKIPYIYPYHQAIGFYMQRAGFGSSDLKRFRKFGLQYDFYLDYNMKKIVYSTEWRLYYPKDL